MANDKIRMEEKEKKVHLWRIAEEFGMADYSFSRRLRHELPEEEQKKILSCIRRIAEKEAYHGT